MEKNIIVPIDFSDISKDVALYADQWAQRTKGKLHFLHVSQMPEMSYYPAHFEQADKFDETEQIARLDAFLTPLDLKADREICHEYGTPYYKILDLVEREKADLVIMAAHSHTMLGRLFMGSNTDYVVHHIHCPLYVFKKPEKKTAKIILVPLDFSKANHMLVETGMEWAERENAELHFVHVMQPVDYSYYGAESSWGVGKAELVLTEEHGQKAITEFLSGHKINVPYKSVVLFSNSSYLRLLEYQQDTNAMLIMIAGHDHSVAGRIFLGSNTDYLLHHVNIPIYVHKEP